MTERDKEQSSQADEFKRHGSTKRPSFWSEYIFLLKTNKKWWMLPLLLVFLAFGILMIFASTGAAPFIYTLF
ncbi:MAG: DUF5989 family protein [Phycisphaerae bacterium]